MFFVSAEIQGTTPPNSATQNYMTPGGSFAYNPYWNGMHPGMTAYNHPYYMAAYCNGQFGLPGMKSPKTGPHRYPLYTNSIFFPTYINRFPFHSYRIISWFYLYATLR